jgi:hypothetical protein
LWIYVKGPSGTLVNEQSYFNLVSHLGKKGLF